MDVENSTRADAHLRTRDLGVSREAGEDQGAGAEPPTSPNEEDNNTATSMDRACHYPLTPSNPNTTGAEALRAPIPANAEYLCLVKVNVSPAGRNRRRFTERPPPAFFAASTTVDVLALTSPRDGDDNTLGRNREGKPHLIGLLSFPNRPLKSMGQVFLELLIGSPGASLQQHEPAQP